MMQRPPLRSRGAALLAAMLTVTLVASFAAAALWQQWRAVEVETAERTRAQAAWILLGALDWSRLILREDGRSSSADHLAEPWSVPLQEARLSTFLAAERNVSQVDDGGIDAIDAFLSGQITDMQARLNLRNLFSDAAMAPIAQRQFTRLFERLGLPQQELALLVDGLRRAHSGTGTDAPLMPQTADQLGWLGLSPTTVALLEPHVAMLPMATPVNLNTADVDVLWAAIDGLDQASALKMVQARESRYFRSLGDVKTLLGGTLELNDSSVLSTASGFFEVRGRLRMGQTTVEERSLVQRLSDRTSIIWRQRNALPPARALAGAQDSANPLRTVTSPP
ncbi:MAG: type II secretion system minor pseudopilin GspK [Acidovorax sp.]|nr:type II secretion system minor pseudopilin GspK [Acidovorax sp.]